MYQIKCDNNIIYDLRDEEYIVINPQLDKEIGKKGELSFQINDTHPFFNTLKLLKSTITLKKGSKTLFKGRIIEEEQLFDKSKLISCESALAFLNDIIYRPFAFTGTPLEFFTAVLDYYNSLVEEDRKIYVGNVTVTDPNDYINRSSEEYLNCLEVLNSRLVDTLGGYLIERYEDDKIYLDYLADIEDTSTQYIEQGSNLLDLLIDNDASTTYTAVLPLGAEIENEDGSKERVTIKSVNSDIDYIVNETAKAKYGLIFAPVSETTWDDVTIPSNLLTKANDFLNNQAVMLKSSLEVSTADLNLVDSSIEPFLDYEYIRFISVPHGIDKTYLLTKLSIPLSKPEGLILTLGETRASLTGIQAEESDRVSNMINTVDKINSDYVVNADVSAVLEEAINQTTSLIQDSETILLSAMEEYTKTGDFLAYQETVSAQLEILSGEITAKFTQTVSQIETLDGETKQTFKNLEAYIRGYMDALGKPVLELGSSESKVLLKVTNDKISFNQNDVEVAYISDNELYITNATILTQINIGAWSWIPRTNNNLSFTYRGGA